jgi:hypothetical protein
VDACPTGEVGRITPALEGFYFLFRRVWPQLWNGMGGVEPDAIRHAFETYRVPRGQRAVLNDFFNIVIGAAREAQEKNKGQGPAKTDAELKADQEKVLAMLPRK